MLQEVVSDAKHTTFAFTERTRNHLDQRDRNRSSGASDLTTSHLVLYGVWSLFIGYSQLLPQKLPILTVCRTASLPAADREGVILSRGDLLAQYLCLETPDLLEVSSRLTIRLCSAVQEIGFATCGKGDERLSSKLGIRISDATVLQSLFLVPLPAIGKLEVIGVDDWSYRQGRCISRSTSCTPKS